MALNTITGMEAAISDWTNAGLNATQVRDLITLGEDRIYRELRVRSMEVSTTSAITGGVVTVPSDYVEMKNCRIDSQPNVELLRKTPQWIYQKYPNRSASGIPRFFARDGSNFVFGPFPSGGYGLMMSYYTRPVTAVGGTLTGIVATSPGLLLFAALAEAEPYLGRDQRIQVWEGKYGAVKTRVEKEDMHEFYSGSDLAVTPS